MPVIYFDSAHHEASFSAKKLLLFLTLLIGCMIIGFFAFSSTREVEGGNLLLERRCIIMSSSEVSALEEGWLIRPSLRPCNGSDNSLEIIAEYSLADSTAIQKLLEDYYSNIICEDAKFFVQKAWHNAGYGSALHLRNWMALKAIDSGRVFIDQPGLQWQFAASHCIDTGPGCYFQPLSECKLPENWREIAIDADDPTLPDLQQHKVISGETPWEASKNITNPFFLQDSRFSKKSFDWWNSQLIRFSLRPNNFTLNHLLIPFSKVIYQSDVYPSNLASIFIRRGDKAAAQEDRLWPTSDYFDALQRFQEESGTTITSVYLSSDSQNAIDEAIQEYGSRYKIYYLPFDGRSKVGWVDSEEIRRNAFLMSKLGVITTVDVFISVNSDVFIGTSGSNQCRLINELRLSHGNFCVKFLKHA